MRHIAPVCAARGGESALRGARPLAAGVYIEQLLDVHGTCDDADPIGAQHRPNGAQRPRRYPVNRPGAHCHPTRPDRRLRTARRGGWSDRPRAAFCGAPEGIRTPNLLIRRNWQTRISAAPMRKFNLLESVPSCGCRRGCRQSCRPTDAHIAVEGSGCAATQGQPSGLPATLTRGPAEAPGSRAAGGRRAAMRSTLDAGGAGPDSRAARARTQPRFRNAPAGLGDRRCSDGRR